ncbi:MAG: ribonuclease III [Hyphomicrobiales bacterium]|nr:ribonuclease III [Hyphomicrobiales bacterium]
MSDRAKIDAERLAEVLGYGFRQQTHLMEALTHASATGEAQKNGDYQRLEFLGDRVLGLIVADMLVEAFPKADEGELARRFNALVRRETCVEVARALDLGAHVILGQSEIASGGRNKRAILADACESVIGAIYRDGGFEAARAFVARNWKPLMLAADRPRRDAKTALQEWAQGRGMPPPVYDVIERTGPDHAPRFKVRALISGLEPAFGEGYAKRNAEQKAAAACLVALGLWEPDEIEDE